MVFQPWNNHARCAAAPLSVPGTVTQPNNDVFNMYRFTAKAIGHTVTIKDYTYTGPNAGGLLLYIINSDRCAAGGTLDVDLRGNKDLVRGVDTTMSFFGLTSGIEYLLIVYTRGGLTDQAYTLTIR